jgi:hypothetical protein
MNTWENAPELWRNAYTSRIILLLFSHYLLITVPVTYPVNEFICFVALNTSLCINSWKGETKGVKFCKVMNHRYWKFYVKCYCRVKVKESRNRPNVAQRVPGGLGSQISKIFGTWKWWDRQRHTPPLPFTPRNLPGTHFHRVLSRPQGHGAVGRKYVTEKFSYTTGNRSRNRPSSSAAP